MFAVCHGFVCLMRVNVMDSLATYAHTQAHTYIQGAPIKNNPLEKNAVFHPWQYGFEPNFQILYVSIHITYCANFIKITDTVTQIQQFKL